MVTEGLRLRFIEMHEVRGLSVAPYVASAFEFAVEHFDTLVTGLFGAWLCDWLKNRKVELEIDDEDVMISSEEIRKALARRADREANQ